MGSKRSLLFREKKKEAKARRRPGGYNPVFELEYGLMVSHAHTYTVTHTHMRTRVSVPAYMHPMHLYNSAHIKKKLSECALHVGTGLILVSL